MKSEKTILVLGAYGLAGRAIVQRLVETTGYSVVAAGRRPDKLQAILREMDGKRVCGLQLDVEDAARLREACTRAAFVINAVGPFSRTGSAVARIAVECGRPFLDCANEQRHYRNLLELDALARSHAVPLITAAGAIPGLSTLLVADMIRRFPETDEVQCCWAQFRHAYPESGLASMMGGILEALDRPIAIQDGNPVRVTLGRSVHSFDLPEPFGTRNLMEVPTIDALTLPRRALREYHTWFFMGDLPLWLLDVVRILQPDRRPWAYRLIENLLRRINDRDTAKAIAAGVGPECLLYVAAGNGDAIQTRHVQFCDGAAATACLPACLADRCLRGDVSEAGLLTPLDLVDPDSFEEITAGVMKQEFN